MIDSAGPGATVHFPPGIHEICKALEPLEGQTWELDGAVLQRCPAIVTSLVSDAPAGSTSVQVEDASGFRVGERVTPVAGVGRLGRTAGEHGPPQHIIRSISSDTIVFANPLSNSYSVGDLFIVIEVIIQPPSAIDDFTLRGGIVDGNRRTNLYYVAWEVASSLNLRGGGNLLMEDMTFTDCWGSCVVAGLHDSTIRRTTFLGGASAGIHLSSASNLTVESSVFRDLNQDAQLAGHSQGAITWSKNNRDITVDHVCIEDIPSDQAVGALADANFEWNSDIYVYNSQFCRVPAVFRGHLNAEPLSDYDPTGYVDIEGNLAVDAGDSGVSVGKSITSPVVGVIFSNNVLVNSTYDWSQTLDPQVQGNTTLPPPVDCSCEKWH